MPMLRLLAASLLALPGALQAAAQTPAASYAPDTLITVDPQDSPTPTTTAPSTFTLSSPSDKPGTTRFSLAPKDRSSTLALTATHTQPLISRLNTLAPETLHPNPSTSLTLLNLPPGTKLSAEQQKNLDKALAGLKELEKSAKITADNQPCYKLHVYGFTPQDLKSPHPHSSTETDCTPASVAHLKVLQLPATPNSK